MKSGEFFLTSRATYDKIALIREKAMKEKSRYPKRYREKTAVRVFAGRIVKQFRSFEPNGAVLVGFNGVPPLQGNDIGVRLVSAECRVFPEVRW